MQQFNVNELIPHPRNNEFFDDITGDKWEEFLSSVRTSGIIEPIIITQDKIIVSGHQRVRACKELGIETVLCEVRAYDTEDQILKDLLETNLRQRGYVSGSDAQVGNRIKELERLYGIEHGGNRGNQYSLAKPNYSVLPKQERLANQLRMSVDTLQNYKLLTEMIPELKELRDTGIVTRTTALAIMKKLSEQEQEELIASMDTTKRITQKEVNQYIARIKELESRPKEVEVVDNTDHEAIARLNNEKAVLSQKTYELEKEIDALRRTILTSKIDPARVTNLVREFRALSESQDTSPERKEASIELTALTLEARSFFEDKLAPIKFKRCMDILGTGAGVIVLEDLESIVHSTEAWVNEMKQYLDEDQEDYIDAEYKEDF